MLKNIKNLKSEDTGLECPDCSKCALEEVLDYDYDNDKGYHTGDWYCKECKGHFIELKNGNLMPLIK